MTVKVIIYKQHLQFPECFQRLLFNEPGLKFMCVWNINCETSDTHVISMIEKLYRSVFREIPRSLSLIGILFKGEKKDFLRWFYSALKLIW